MRNFIISLICFFITICLWTGFCLYSKNHSDELESQTNQLIASINKGDWISAESNYDNLHSEWNKYKTIAEIFLDSKDLNEIDSTMSKAYLYLRAEDISNSSGEFSYLKDKFKYIRQSNALTFNNIF